MSASRVHSCNSVSQALTLIKRRSGLFSLLFSSPADEERCANLRDLQPTFFSLLSKCPPSALALRLLYFSSSCAEHLLCEEFRARLPARGNVASRGHGPCVNGTGGTRFPVMKQKGEEKKSPRCDLASRQLSYDYYWQKGSYLLTRFHHTPHSANKQTLRARAAVGQRVAPPTGDVIGHWAIQSRCCSPPPLSTTPPPLHILSLFLRALSRSKRAARAWMISGGDEPVCASGRGQITPSLSFQNISLLEKT